MKTRLRVDVHGAVQGVGFRPFIYRLATGLGLTGWVANTNRGVQIEVEGEGEVVEEFVLRIPREMPAIASIQGIEHSRVDPEGAVQFEIRESRTDGITSALVLPDIATCPKCVEEVFDPANRRFMYPFTNCTNCGPRFSIITSIPYDRANTTMRQFAMCDRCRREFEDPADRRFHAQPNACPNCGPHLELWERDGSVLASRTDAILEAADMVRRGLIIALKGIGGFQLIADATNNEAVRRLRVRKQREEKPLALLYPALARIRMDCDISPMEEHLLLSPQAPIVLLKRKKGWVNASVPIGNGISEFVAPGNPNIGAMIPYSPLHHIFMKELNTPVVATSGNVSDEPICTDEHEALVRLAGIADAFLVHNRPIERHVDDSVVRMMSDRVQVVRRARGYAPLPVELPNFDGREVLAVGGHLKNTVAVTNGPNAFVSQHIGDLSTGEALRAFEKVTADLKGLFTVRPVIFAHDTHPDYASTRFATSQAGEAVGVQHHFAHVASCMAENNLDGTVLGVSWDGTGFGEDGTVWGGEFLLTDGASFARRGYLRQFRLPGSSAAVKEPRRSALGVLYETLGESLFEMKQLEPVKQFEGDSLKVLRKMLKGGFNSPLTSSAGRLFDAVSSILGIRQVTSFEGQGAMELEFAIRGSEEENAYDYSVDTSSVSEGREPVYVLDWRGMIGQIVREASSPSASGLVPIRFHNTLVEMIADLASRVGEEKVVLTGGCFQNRYLTEHALSRLTRMGFKVYIHQRVPPNDGGISLGQLFVALNRSRNPGMAEKGPRIRSQELTSDR